MARIPFAKWKPLPANATAPGIDVRTCIGHTMVGTLAGVDSYFRSGRSGGIESTVGIGCQRCVDDGVTSEDGEIWQWMDSAKRADANYHANSFAASWETCDHYRGGTYTNPPLSPGQVRSWIRLGIWYHEEHGVPLRRCRSWDDGGYGYHSMWGSPSQWTPAAGKTCPNPTRIRQFNDAVLPAIISGQLEEDDLPYTEQELINIVRTALVTSPGIEVKPGSLFSKVVDIQKDGDQTRLDLAPTGDRVIADILRRVSNSDEIQTDVAQLKADVAAIKAQLAPPV